MTELNKPLTIDEIEFRVQSVTAKGAIILPYKDARADMNRLDESVGALNWKRENVVIDGNIHCIVSIWCDKKQQWVSKMDVGTESNTEAVKGQVSDAFKRACFNWGIGRELYDYPLIFVQLNNEEKANPKAFNFALKKWRWHSEFSDGKLSYLGAHDGKSIRFEYGKRKNIVKR
jgi:hypothetical protein